MREFFRRVRTHWNTSDTVLFSSTGAAFLILIGNCWWKTPLAVYVASLIPLALLAVRARLGDRTIQESLIFGGLVGCLWPVGEWFVVTYFGWWGSYTAGGPRILETPVYCMLIGWIASSYCFYQGKRTLELGYGAWASGFASGLAAFAAGIVGENMFVAARMWVYDSSNFDWWSVPAFVPISYGIAYATIPLTKRLAIVPRSLIFTTVTLIVSVALGLGAGFFPRAEGKFHELPAREQPVIRSAFAQTVCGETFHKGNTNDFRANTPESRAFGAELVVS